MSGIDPDRRLAKLPVGGLDPEQRQLYDTIVGGPRAAGPQAFALVDSDGCLEGPFNAMLLSPRLGTALQSLGATARYGTSLSPRCLEIAILTVAHHCDSDFEIYAHEAAGRRAGLTDDELTALRERVAEVFVDQRERVVAQTAGALLSEHDLDDARFREAETVVGTRGLFELSTIVGYYVTLALQLQVFRVRRPR